MFNDIVTVYNKYKDDTTEKWQRTVLAGVFWNAIKGTVMRKTGASSADGVQLIIPIDVKASRTYKPPKEWAKLDSKMGFWTLQSGDTVVLGDIQYDVVKSSKELLEYDNCITITSVDIKLFGGSMAHFEVSGR